MSKLKTDGVANGASVENELPDPIEAAEDNSNNEIVLTAATVVVVGVGAAIFEAALLPGLALGVVAALAPKVLPGLGASLNPLFRSTVRGAYKVGQKTKEMMAEAHEHVNDIVAEVHAEGDKVPPAGKSAQAAPAA
jgi:hypothetical protein